MSKDPGDVKCERCGRSANDATRYITARGISSRLPPAQMCDPDRWGVCNFEDHIDFWRELVQDEPALFFKDKKGVTWRMCQATPGGTGIDDLGDSENSKARIEEIKKQTPPAAPASLDWLDETEKLLKQKP